MDYDKFKGIYQFRFQYCEPKQYQAPPLLEFNFKIHILLKHLIRPSLVLLTGILIILPNCLLNAIACQSIFILPNSFCAPWWSHFTTPPSLFFQAYPSSAVHRSYYRWIIAVFKIFTRILAFAWKHFKGLRDGHWPKCKPCLLLFQLCSWWTFHISITNINRNWLTDGRMRTADRKLLRNVKAEIAIVVRTTHIRLDGWPGGDPGTMHFLNASGGLKSLGFSSRGMWVRFVVGRAARMNWSSTISVDGWWSGTRAFSQRSQDQNIFNAWLIAMVRVHWLESALKCFEAHYGAHEP